MDENTSDRFGSFFDRVQTERTALKIINEVFDSRKLHGLTEAAINSWFADALRNEKGGAPIKEIASILNLKTAVEMLGQAAGLVRQGLWRFDVKDGAVGAKPLKPLLFKGFSQPAAVN